MSYTVVSVKDDIIFYLTSDRYASDIPDRAAEFDTEEEANKVAESENRNRCWRSEFIWNSNLEVRDGQ